jgi:hypothetical protein
MRAFYTEKASPAKMDLAGAEKIKIDDCKKNEDDF